MAAARFCGECQVAGARGRRARSPRAAGSPPSKTWQLLRFDAAGSARPTDSVTRLVNVGSSSASPRPARGPTEIPRPSQSVRRHVDLFSAAPRPAWAPPLRPTSSRSTCTNMDMFSRGMTIARHQSVGQGPPARTWTCSREVSVIVPRRGRRARTGRASVLHRTRPSERSGGAVGVARCAGVRSRTYDPGASVCPDEGTEARRAAG